MKISIPQAVLSWLQHRDSFMQRLKDHQVSAKIRVLRQAWLFPEIEERVLLRLSSRRYVFSREVLIHHEAKALLYARALIPTATLKGKEGKLKCLGEQSLGSVLFSYPDLKRSAFEFKLYHLRDYAVEPLWGRRSIFYFRGKSLLLEEVFLPELVEKICRVD